MRTFKSNVPFMIVKLRVDLKGTYYAKFTFSWCLNINVCWQCVSKTTLE